MAKTILETIKQIDGIWVFHWRDVLVGTRKSGESRKILSCNWHPLLTSKGSVWLNELGSWIT